MPLVEPPDGMREDGEGTGVKYGTENRNRNWEWNSAVRDRLVELGIDYLDLTGNIRIAVERPALFIETVGAEVNPDKEARGSRTLRGGKAAGGGAGCVVMPDLSALVGLDMCLTALGRKSEWY